MVAGDGGGREGLAQAADRHTPQEAYVAHMGKVRKGDGENGGREGWSVEQGGVWLVAGARCPIDCWHCWREVGKQGLMEGQAAYVAHMGKVRMINGGGRVGERRGECMGKVRMRMSVRTPPSAAGGSEARQKGGAGGGAGGISDTLGQGAHGRMVEGWREWLVGDQEAYVAHVDKLRTSLMDVRRRQCLQEMLEGGRGHAVMSGGAEGRSFELGRRDVHRGEAACAALEAQG